jgi:hypothetical protein
MLEDKREQPPRSAEQARAIGYKRRLAVELARRRPSLAKYWIDNVGVTYRYVAHRFFSERFADNQDATAHAVSEAVWLLWRADEPRTYGEYIAQKKRHQEARRDPWIRERYRIPEEPLNPERGASRIRNINRRLVSN